MEEKIFVTTSLFMALLKSYNYLVLNLNAIFSNIFFIIFFQLNTITSNTLTSVPAVTTTDCTIATTGDPTVAEIIACINALQTDINSNIVTPINAYGNPTC